MPRSERNHKVCAGRIELMVHDLDDVAKISLVHYGTKKRALKQLGATVTKKDAYSESSFVSRNKFSN